MCEATFLTLYFFIGFLAVLGIKIATRLRRSSAKFTRDEDQVLFDFVVLFFWPLVVVGVIMIEGALFFSFLTHRISEIVPISKRKKEDESSRS